MHWRLVYNLLLTCSACLGVKDCDSWKYFKIQEISSDDSEEEYEDEDGEKDDEMEG